MRRSHSRCTAAEERVTGGTSTSVTLVLLKEGIADALIQHLQQSMGGQLGRGGCGRQAKQLLVRVAQHEPQVAALTVAQRA